MPGGGTEFLLLSQPGVEVLRHSLPCHFPLGASRSRWRQIVRVMRSQLLSSKDSLQWEEEESWGQREFLVGILTILVREL